MSQHPNARLTPRGRAPLCERVGGGMRVSDAALARRPESAGRADARAAVVGAFGDSGGAYGYRRIAAQTGIGEQAVRAIMGKESLVARAAKKRRRHSSVFCQ